jgi:hypothetical protein
VEDEEAQGGAALELPSQDDRDRVVEEEVTSSDPDVTDLGDLYDFTLPPLTVSLPEEDYPRMEMKPLGPPPPLTAHELVRRSKVIEAVAPSTLWVPANSLQGGELVS